MSNPAPPTPPAPLVTTDDDEQKRLGQIAEHLTQATNIHHNATQITPAQNQNAMPSWAPATETREEPPGEGNEPEIVDIIKGYQGRMRTGNASDFLNSKMKWLSKKNKGAEVKLK